jgi:hypothetical protein
MSNVIARAEKEVFLATNYWMLSEPTKLICNGLRELSRKAVEKQRRIVVKIMYDRGNPKQVLVPQCIMDYPSHYLSVTREPSQGPGKGVRGSERQGPNPSPG